MKTFKTLLSSLLAVVMCGALLPSVANAEETFACQADWHVVDKGNPSGTPYWEASINGIAIDSTISYHYYK